MTNTTSSTPGAAAQKALNSPMRDLVRAVLYFAYNGEASISDIRSTVRSRFDDELPRNWRVQVRDVLKHDPEIEKAEEDAWVLRTPGASEA